MQKTTTLTPTLRTLAILGVSLAVLLSYNFMSAAWTAAPANPPANNTEAPINVGGTEQVKTGTLGVQNGAPSILLDDTGTDNNRWWLHSNAYGSGPRFHLLYDRNNNERWDAGDVNPALYVQIGAAADGSNDTVSTPGRSVADIFAAAVEVRSDRYCDAMGENCMNLDPATNSPRILQVHKLNPTGGDLARFLTNIEVAKSYWNKIVSDTVAAETAIKQRVGQESALVSSGWEDICQWKENEDVPTEGDGDSSASDRDRLDWCGSLICRYYPGLDHINTALSEISHCGITNGKGCKPGNFTISCLY